MMDQSVISENTTVNISPITSRGFDLIRDPMIICPLDENHRIRLSEFQSHLERCLIGDLMEKTCPRNPLHVVDEASYDHHVKHCTDITTQNESQHTPPES